MRRTLGRLLYGQGLWVVFFACAAAAEGANLPLWTHAASAGTPDESAWTIVRLVQGEATLQPGVAPPASITMRYNIVALDGLFSPLTPTSWPSVGIRYRDNGTGAQVIATVKSYDYTTGLTTVLAQFYSDRYRSSTAYQTRTFGSCARFSEFDFATKAYFIEVQLVKSAEGGDPGVGVLFASRYGVCTSE